MLVVARETGIPAEALQVDLSIARGLDYYTGTIFETFLTDMPQIGSVCSGGRYDNLAGLYTKVALPGVGASLGLDRLLAAMEEMKLLPSSVSSAPVFMVRFSQVPLGAYESTAAMLRAGGVGVELYPEEKKIGSQLQYAEKRGFKLAVIAGPDDFSKGEFKIKDLVARQEISCAKDQLLAQLRTFLGFKYPE